MLAECCMQHDAVARLMFVNAQTRHAPSQTMALRECMLLHKDYYAPLLEEEEAAMKEIKRSEEAEQAAVAAGVADPTETEVVSGNSAEPDV